MLWGPWSSRGRRSTWSTGKDSLPGKERSPLPQEQYGGDKDHRYSKVDNPKDERGHREPYRSSSAPTKGVPLAAFAANLFRIRGGHGGASPSFASEDPHLHGHRTPA